MEQVLFADESGTNADSPCYTIGALSVGKQFVGQFNSFFYDLKRHHRVNSTEVKWSAFRARANVVNFAQALLCAVLKSQTARFHAIVVRKQTFEKWKKDEYDAFYTTYSYVIRSAASGSSGPVEVFYDQRTERYNKENEKLQKITNSMLGQIRRESNLRAVSQGQSHLLPGIQAADVFTGAINTAHALFLRPDTPCTPAKAATIEHFSEILGIPGLHCDTYPSEDFNIWHFPKDYRGVPQTIERPVRDPVFVPVRNSDLKSRS